MKKLVVWSFVGMLAAGGVAAMPAGVGPAAADTCPTSYVDPTACANPTSTTSATATVSVSVSASVDAGGAAAAAARLATTCQVATTSNHRTAVFSVTAPGATVTGGTLLVNLHKVGTPKSKKQKMAISPYSRALTKRLSAGVWHGTMVYKPAADSPFSYCGVVFRSLRIAKKKHARHHASVKFPTSVTAGLRSETP